jgi:hypothetical protein
MNISEKFQNLKKRSIINILRNKYNGNMQEAYLKELNLKPQKCIYCNNNAVFLSIFKGYRKTCKNHECSKKLVSDTNKNLSKSRIIKEYVKLKCNICNKDFYVRNVKGQTNRYICDHKKCKSYNKYLLKETYKISNFITNDIYFLNKITYDLMCKFNDIKRVKRILYKNLLDNDIKNFKNIINNNIIISWFFKMPFNKDDYFLLPDNLIYIYKNYKYKSALLKKIYGNNLLKFYKTYYKERVKKCVICNKEFIYDLFKLNKKCEITCSLKCYYKNFKHYVTDERKVKQSITMKKLILNGKFTPNVFNSNTRKNIELKTPNNIIKFRSSWEVIFYVMYDNSINLKYEKLRIPYTINKNNRIYIVDFIDEENNIVYEIKPFSKIKNKINIQKNKSLKNWCINNKYNFKYIDEFYLYRFNYNIFEKL